MLFFKIDLDSLKRGLPSDGVRRISQVSLVRKRSLYKPLELKKNHWKTCTTSKLVTFFILLCL